MKWLITLWNLIRPMCPSGLPHRQRHTIITNRVGGKWCWHPECIEASIKQVIEIEQERRMCNAHLDIVIENANKVLYETLHTRHEGTTNE